MLEKEIRRGKEGSDAAQGGSEGLASWIKKIKRIRPVLEKCKLDQRPQEGGEDTKREKGETDERKMCL